MGKDEDCSRVHVNWVAAGVAVAVLCGMFGLAGWLLSDRVGVSTTLTNLSDRVGALEKSVDDLSARQVNVVIPSLSKVSQGLEDINARLDRARLQESLDHHQIGYDPPLNKKRVTEKLGPL